MKVIKASIDLETWSLKYSCPHCVSEIEIEPTDIYYDYVSNDEPPWRVNCCLCDGCFRLDQDSVPKIVQTDVTKNRYVRKPSSDW